MKKRFWVSIAPFEPERVSAAIEAGAEAVVVPPGTNDQVKQLGRIITVSDDGDWQWDRDVSRARIDSEADETHVDPHRLTVLDPAEWTIIPLENLLSRGAQVIQTVRTAQEARTALTTMEHGAAGILLIDANPETIRAVGAVVSELATPPVELTTARICSIEPAGLGDRGCLDTIGLFAPGEGLLIGDYAHAQFLVHSENLITEHCAARPFRVNAGAVHGYVRLPDDRTRYLGEVRSGDEVLVVGSDGHTRRIGVGRNKIERRPMLHVLAETENGTRISAMLQNAETICLVAPDGQPRRITELQPGDAILTATSPIVGRHFGRAIEESIREQ